MIYKNKLILLIFLFVLLIIYYITNKNINNFYVKPTKSNMFVIKLPVAPGSGFFSCCSLKLDKIVNFINSNKILPYEVNSSKHFFLYKNHINKNKDITFDYFENYNNIKNIEISFPIKYRHMDQYKDYSTLDYKNISPLIKKYFSPSVKINKIINNIKKKYNLIYENILAVYYRGTDKKTETKIANFNDFYKKIIEIININKNIKILIQTDTAQFMDYINSKNLKNVIVLNENKMSYKDKGIHNEKSSNTNYNDMFYFLSTVIIISKCKYIICSSGNCSIWMMLYRGNNKNVIQYLKGTWYNNVF